MASYSPTVFLCYLFLIELLFFLVFDMILLLEVVVVGVIVKVVLVLVFLDRLSLSVAIVVHACICLPSPWILKRN